MVCVLVGGGVVGLGYVLWSCAAYHNSRRFGLPIVIYAYLLICVLFLFSVVCGFVFFVFFIFVYYFGFWFAVFQFGFCI